MTDLERKLKAARVQATRKWFVDYPVEPEIGQIGAEWGCPSGNADFRVAGLKTEI